MELALQTLPEDLRKRIVGLSIKHDASTDSSGYVREGFDPVTDVRKTEGAVHPIVRRNRETDREALYLGRRRLLGRRLCRCQGIRRFLRAKSTSTRALRAPMVSGFSTSTCTPRSSA